MRQSNPKVKIITIIFSVIICLIIMNVTYVAITKKHLRTQVNILQFQENKALYQVEEKAKRGTIYDRNGEVIAQDIERYHLYLVLDEKIVDPATKNPLYVVDKQKTADVLHEHLNIPKEEALKYLNQPGILQAEIGQYGKSITKEVKENIEKTGLPGIRFTQVLERVYPTGKFASNILGYARFDENLKRIKGEIGIEQYFDSYLAGEDGIKQYKVGKDGQIIPGKEKVIKSVKNGNDIYLTVDKNIQAVVETLVEKEDRTEKWAIVANAKTGEILGVATSTGFDLNTKDITSYANIIGDSPYEPGSVIKAFTYAAAMDTNTFDDTRLVDSNHYYVGLNENRDVIRLSSDANAVNTIYNSGRLTYGHVTYKEALARSLNSTTVELVVSHLKFKPLREYFDKFKLYENVDTPGISSVAGVANFKGPIETLNTSFGQGSTTTALNLVQGYTAILNNGIMSKPYIIESVMNPYTKQKVLQYKPEQYEVLKRSTSEKMREYLKAPVEEDYGTARIYKIQGVDILGKTGTAEIVENGRYVTDKYIYSAVIAAPAQDPEIVLYFAQKAPSGNYPSSSKIKSTVQISLDTLKVTSQAPKKLDERFEVQKIDNYINHTKEFTESKMKDVKADVYYIGNGDSIINQYPSKDEDIVLNRKIFFYTGGVVKMPNMLGWTYKEVVAFSRLTGIGISVKGSGKVEKQNISVNTIISAETDIIVELK